MPVSGPAGILAFYILSACGYSGLFYHHKSPYSLAGIDLTKYVAIPLCSILIYIAVRHLCHCLTRLKTILPAEQIVMDVKRMNINFTLVGAENKQ